MAVGERAEAAREQEHARASPAASPVRSAAACSRRSAAGTGPGTGTGSEARIEREGLDVAGREVAVAEQPQRQHRFGGPSPRARRTRRSNSTPPISVPLTAGLEKPSRGCSISAKTVPREARAASAAPGMSTLRPACRPDRGRDRDHDQPQAHGVQRDVDQEHRPPARQRRAAPADQRAEDPGDRAPCGPGPDRPPPLAPARRCRRSPPASWGRAVPRRTPWRARAATKNPIVGAAAQATEATPKPTTPSANTRRSP